MKKYYKLDQIKLARFKKLLFLTKKEAIGLQFRHPKTNKKITVVDINKPLQLENNKHSTGNVIFQDKDKQNYVLFLNIT